MSFKFDRRDFLKQSAFAATAAGIGLAATREAHATVPSGHFDVYQASTALWSSSKALKENCVWQSFAFDNTHSKIFYVQQLGSAGNVTPGCLRLCYMHLDGTPNGGHYMDLIGFGHGQGMGVEVSGTDTYIWIGCDAYGDGGTGSSWNPDPDTYNVNNFGRKICRFKWTEGVTGTYYTSDLGTSKMPGSAIYNLESGSTYNDCVIDPVSLRLLYRRVRSSADGGGTRYNVYNLSDIKTSGASATPIYADQSFPAYPYLPDGVTQSKPLQGMMIYGNYGYYLTGTYWTNSSGGAVCHRPSGDDGNVYLTCFNLSNPSSHVSCITKAGVSYNYREPEGMGVQLLSGGGARLHFGLMNAPTCTTTSGTSSPKEAGLFYKDSILNDGL